MKHDRYLENINRILEPIQRQLEIYNNVMNSPAMKAMEAFQNQISHITDYAEIQANIYNSFLPWLELTEAIRQQIDLNNLANPHFSVSEELSDEIYSFINKHDVHIPEEIISKENIKNKQKLTRDQIIGIIGLLLTIWFRIEDKVLCSNNVENKETQIKMQELINIAENIFQAIEDQKETNSNDNKLESTQNESDKISENDDS